jgi:hypothetical protein
LHFKTPDKDARFVDAHESQSVADDRHPACTIQRLQGARRDAIPRRSGQA